MTTEQIIGLIIALLIMFVGAAGSVLPILPGTPVVLAGAIAHRLYFGESSASTLLLIILVLLTAFSYVLDYIAQMIGARKLGATWRGVTGAVVGGIIGLFFSIPGIILGPFIGATLLELAGGREWKPAARAGLGAVLGLLLGAVGKFCLSLVMIGLFTVNVIYRST